MLPSENRLKKSSEFETAYKKGKHLKGIHGKLVVYDRADGLPARIGIVVTGKLGNAVKRNRAKRMVREVFRKHLSQLSDGIDLSYILWDISFSFQNIEKDIVRLLKRAGLMVETKP